MNSMKKTILSLLALIMACTLQAQSTQTLYKATPRANSKIYVQDNTGWNDLSLYAWIGSGENGNMKPWPGIHYTGVTTIAGNPYKVLEMTSSYEGQPLNWIFNNNNGGKQFDAMKHFTLTDDLYMRLTLAASRAASARTSCLPTLIRYPPLRLFTALLQLTTTLEPSH